jgi:hypothetical protein
VRFSDCAPHSNEEEANPMGSDYVIEALREGRVPGSAQARERAVAAARDAYRARPAATGKRGWRLAIGAAAIGLLGALSFTPPGEAATGWIGRVVGIGESPSLEQVGSVQGSAVVIDSGTLSDGTPYELVAKLVTPELLPGPSPWEVTPARGPTEAEIREFRSDPDLICFTVDWPGIEAKGQGGNCTRADGSGSPGGAAIETPGLFRPPYAPGTKPADLSFDPAEPDAPAILFGILNDPTVDRVEVVRRDRDGSTSQLPVEVIDLSGKLLERVGETGPVSVFESVLDREDVAAGRDQSATIEAVALDDQGRELYRLNPFPDPACDLGQLRRAYLRRQTEKGRARVIAKSRECLHRTAP